MKEKIFTTNAEFFQVLIETIKRLEEGQILIVEKKGNTLKCHCKKAKA